jgi:DNA polymerase-3 subunit beta
MKMTTDKKLLSLATNRTQGALSERSTGQIGIKAQTDHFELAATDRNLAIYSRIDCLTQEPGFAFVPAKLFSDVVRELPPGPVEISTDASWLTVRAGEKNSYTMKLPLVDELVWRDAPNTNTAITARLPAERIRYMIEQVQFCIAHESPRNYGAVAYLHKVDSETLRLVGTDGFRLSYCDVTADSMENFLPAGICLTKRAITELQRMSSEGFEFIELSLSADGTTLIAEVPDYKLFIRLSSVKYPNYTGVLPKQQASQVVVSRSQVQSMAKRVLLAADKTKALQLNITQSSLTLSSKSSTGSEGREDFPLSGYTGKDYRLAINGKFLSDVFSTTTSDMLHLQFENEDDPIVIVPSIEPSSCRSKHVLVPIKESY